MLFPEHAEDKTPPGAGGPPPRERAINHPVRASGVPSSYNWPTTIACGSRYASSP